MGNALAAIPEWEKSMDNLFITALAEPISGWMDAFPDLDCQHGVDAINDTLLNSVVWLHQPSGSSVDLNEVIQSLKRIRAAHPIAKVVVLSNQPDNQQAIAAIQAGALAYCHAYAEPDLLIKIQHVVAEGGLWLGEGLLQQLIQSTQTQVGNSAISVDTLMAKLTRREQQVAQAVAKGLTNKEIARELEITERTVKAHVASIFERIGAKDRLQLALMLTQKA